MVSSADTSRGSLAIEALAVLGVLALGVWLRARAILQFATIGAEDPFTHVVLAREALERGYFGDSYYLGNQLYPPGLHALVAPLFAVAGSAPVDVARWLPLAFGISSILGMYALARRYGGAVAGVSASLAVAIIPEQVFRSQLLFPTSLDLAILPAYLMAFIEASDGSDAWAACFGALTIVLAFAHPWAVPLFAGAGLLFALLRLARRDITWRHAARASVLASTSIAFAAASRWSQPDSGFAGFLAHVPLVGRMATPTLPVPFVFALVGASTAGGCALAIIACLALTRAPKLATAGAIAAVALGVVLASLTALGTRVPQDVSYPHMVGAPLIVISGIGLLLALAFPTRLSDLGLSIFVPLMPLTAVDVFQGGYWPSRTVVYWTLGIALLVAHVAALVARALERAPTPGPAAFRAPVAMGAAFLLVGGAVAAHPTHDYAWYRLYADDETSALQHVADLASHHAGSRVMVETWQPNVVLRAIGPLSLPWYDPAYFSSATERSTVRAEATGPLFVLVDSHTRADASAGHGDLGFVRADTLVYSGANAAVRLYEAP